MNFPSQIPNVSLTTDVLIIAAIAAITIVGSMIGHARLKLLSMSIYVGAGIAMLAVPLAYSMLGSPGGFLALVNLKFLALGICIGVLGLTGGNAYHHGAKNSGVINMVIAALSGLLLVTISLMLMEPGALAATKGSSTLAMVIYHTRLAWLLGAPVLLMVGGFFHGKRH